jgi:hypothetical protein
VETLKKNDVLTGQYSIVSSINAFGINIGYLSIFTTAWPSCVKSTTCPVNLFICGGNKVETLKKNDVLTGQVVDLTHEGHAVVKTFINFPIAKFFFTLITLYSIVSSINAFGINIGYLG